MICLPINTNSTGETLCFTFLKAACNFESEAMLQNVARTSLICFLYNDDGGSVRPMSHCSNFGAVGDERSGRFSQQNNSCVRHWKSRPRLVSQWITVVSPSSGEMYFPSNSNRNGDHTESIACNFSISKRSENMTCKIAH